MHLRNGSVRQPLSCTHTWLDLRMKIDLQWSFILGTVRKEERESSREGKNSRLKSQNGRCSVLLCASLLRALCLMEQRGCRASQSNAVRQSADCLSSSFVVRHFRMPRILQRAIEREREREKDTTVIVFQYLVVMQESLAGRSVWSKCCRRKGLFYKFSDSGETWRKEKTTRYSRSCTAGTIIYMNNWLTEK